MYTVDRQLNRSGFQGTGHQGKIAETTYVPGSDGGGGGACVLGRVGVCTERERERERERESIRLAYNQFRQILFNTAREINSQFDTMTTRDKFVMKNVWRSVAKFVKDAWHQRKRQLFASQ